MQWEGMADSTPNTCDTCTEAITAYTTILKEPNLFHVHTHARVLTEKLSSSKEKQSTLKKIVKIVCALQNTKGGDILVHLDGHKKGDRYLGHFDDFLDSNLSNLIPDGSLYTEIYNRQWLCELKGLEQHEHIVILKVKRSQCITTVDFKTKVCTDFKSERASTPNIVSILSNKSFPEKIKPVLKGIDNFGTSLHENRSIELKVYMPTEPIDTVDKFVSFIWEKLRFKERLTTLSKVSGGGSYFVGVKENEEEHSDYKSKYLQLLGLSARWSLDDIKTALQNKVHDEASVLLDNGCLVHFPCDMIKVGCYLLENKNRVLEIAVGRIDGIVFYDKKGPETYTIDEQGEIWRMTSEEWFKEISKITTKTVLS